MKLYTARLSPFAARCRMQIYARQLDVEFIEYPHGVTKDELVAMHPMGKIPILAVGDTILPESETICEYLEDLDGDIPMRPADELERARMRLLSRVSDFYVFEPLSPLFAHLSRKYRDQDVVDAGLADIAKGLATLERFIADSGYAVGDRLSLADCCLVPTLFFLVTYLPILGDREPLKPYPRLDRYWRAIRQNEYAARVVEEIREGIAEKTAQAQSGKSAS